MQQAKIKDILEYYGIDVQQNKAICPFHDDSKPSMMINEKKQIAKCFACGVGGNAISFVKKYEKEINHKEITTNEAIAKVVEIENLDIDISRIKQEENNYKYSTLTKTYSDEEKKILEINEFLAKLFNYNLTAIRGESYEYLQNRGISDEMMKEMQLGFAIKGQVLQLIDSKFSPTDLIELGLIRLGESQYYEVFEDRIMYPITDEKGNVVTFAGRSIHNEEPKYLHTAETPIFHKKELLYNYSNAKNYSYNDEMYIVEGYMDVIGAKKLGFDNVVAIMGTAITPEQMNLLKTNNCSITLALDNDNAGIDSMIKHIPILLSQGFDINVVDLSKLGEFKDFGDIGNSDIKKEDIQKVKVSAMDYMLEKSYFKDKELNAQNIYKVFQQIRKDKLVISTLDEAMYKEYILKNTSLSSEELDDIMYPKDLSSRDPVMNFQFMVMDDFLIRSLGDYLVKRNDKVLSSYFKDYQKELEDKIVELFNKDSFKYLSKNTQKLNIALLVHDAIVQDENYINYETIHRFKHDNVFNKTYIKNINGSSKVDLSFEQKQMVIKQYETGLNDKDKLALEEVEELYIINDISDLDGILNSNNPTMVMLKENIQERMRINKNSMDYFKYGNLFLHIDKDFISDEFKGENGDYKTILFFNNLNGQLDLKKEQLTKEDSTIEKIKEKSEPEENKEFIYSINHILFYHELETETDYFVRIPNTKAKYFFYIPKSEGKWSDDHEMLYSSLDLNKNYKIYDEKGNFIKELSGDKIKGYWEDKTEQKNKPEKSEKEELKNTKYVPEKSPVCKVFKTKILEETSNGYYCNIRDNNTLIFISKEICKWNADKSYLIIHPRKNFLKGTGLSLYNVVNDTKKFAHKIPFNEIKKYLKIFYPASYKNETKHVINIPLESCKIKSNFLEIPIKLDNTEGYINVSVAVCKKEDNYIKVELSKNEQLSFYSKNGTFIGNYSYDDINSSLNNISIKNKEIEKEVA